MNGSPKFTSIFCDVNNPGHVLACCGLLELSHRLFPLSEGWFLNSRFNLSGYESDEAPDVVDLINRLSKCRIEGLTPEEQNLRECLEKENREKKNLKMKLDSRQEERRVELAKKARAGPLYLGEPFNFKLDWWVPDDALMKTWAGRQELQRIVKAMQAAIIEIKEADRALDFGSPLREASGESKSGSRKKQVKKVEPFYFDARRVTNRLDMGFSFDALEVESVSYPLVELLSLIGLQRFRPKKASRDEFEYALWDHPMGVASASSIFSTTFYFPGSLTYKFTLKYRDGQGRYKGFSFSELIT